MMKRSFLYLLLASCLYACHTASQEASESTISVSDTLVRELNPPAHISPASVLMPKDTAALPAAIREQKRAWMETLNKPDYAKLHTFYWESAGLNWSRELLQDPEELLDPLTKIAGVLGKLREQQVHSVIKHDEEHYLEMGFYHFASDTIYTFAYITAWKTVEGQWLRELEVLNSLRETDQFQLAEIDEARRIWQERSNAHDHQELVAKSYDVAGFYFNQGKIYRGTAAISEVYSYMSQPNWQITLTPLSILPVSADLVYELGQYQSGGFGHYLIIWIKQQDGTWQVLLDFNF